MTIPTEIGSAMRLRIAHSTSYRYEPPASGVIQILRMTPSSHDGQYVAEWQIDVSTDSRLDMHQDAFDNVTHVLTHGPIADLTICVEGLIETHDTGGDRPVQSEEHTSELQSLTNLVCRLLLEKKKKKKKRIEQTTTRSHT